MADVLLMRESFVNPRPDRPHAFHAGYVVDVFPDGRLGPGPDQHERFVIIRIPGVTVDEVREFTEALDEIDPVDLKNPRFLKRRKHQLNFSRIPTPIRNKLERDREITIDEAVFRAAMDLVSA